MRKEGRKEGREGRREGGRDALDDAVAGTGKHKVSVGRPLHALDRVVVRLGRKGGRAGGGGRGETEG